MRWFALPLLLWLAACSSLPDSRPTAVREAEQLLFQGVDAFEENDFHRAGEYFARALGAYRSIDDSEGQLIAHLNLLETALISRRLAFADQQLEAAQRIHERGETTAHYQRRIQLLHAHLAVLRDNTGLALEQLQPLLPAFDENNRPEGRVLALSRSAVTLRTQLAFVNGTEDEQATWLQRLEACTDKGDALQNARLQRFQALAESDGVEAEKMLRAALVVYREQARRPELSETLGELAGLLQTQGREGEAEDLRQRAELVEAYYRLPAD